MLSFLKRKLAFLHPLVVQYRLFRQQKNPQKIFTDIYKRNAWGCDESYSGWNSTLATTADLRKQLPELFSRYQISSMNDIPCGDFNWMKAVELGSTFYFGGDIVPALIEANKRKWESENRKFGVINLLSDPLPKADLFLCRGCLDHFSEADVKKTILNIRKSGCTYLLATTYPKALNSNILTGDYRPINLTAPPYNFPEALLLIPDDEDALAGSEPTKYLGLWQVSGLPNF